MVLSYPKSGWQTLMFADTNDLCLGYFLTLVSPEDSGSGVTVEDMRHEPLAF